MDIKEAYRVMQKASGIEVGGKVKVLRGYTTDEMGCDAVGCNLKRGKGLVTELHDNYVAVRHDEYTGYPVRHPFFVLEIIEKANKNMITVNGKEYSEDTLDKAMKEYVNK